MEILIVFVEENKPALTEQSPIASQIKQTFSKRWQGQFTLVDKPNDAKLDYLKQRNTSIDALKIIAEGRNF
ncbi:MAG: hypothetical protein Q7U38_02810 [Methylobacter sp.]|nr:hypothetical protein [Methylobacter sp.]MDP2100428.1 hypothetical protein [Methylobacter sp.]MDP2428288.1 hypothetical protein [Methylobacter sp.]MDP3055639.1 hypothetical protein [Methylobacter sp.]MDP3361425.1 hypothetical protein [Methylobacter sp.]